jgi:hypothetical protein
MHKKKNARARLVPRRLNLHDVCKLRGKLVLLSGFRSMADFLEKESKTRALIVVGAVSFGSCVVVCVARRKRKPVKL